MPHILLTKALFDKNKQEIARLMKTMPTIDLPNEINVFFLINFINKASVTINFELLDFLISIGLNVNDNFIKSCIEQKNTALLDALFKRGANVKNNAEFLCSAIYSRSIQILELLLANNADPNAKYKDAMGFDICVLDTAVAINNVDAVRLLLNAGADPNTRNGKNQETPFAAAYRLGYVEVCALLQKGMTHYAKNSQKQVHATSSTSTLNLQESLENALQTKDELKVIKIIHTLLQLRSVNQQLQDMNINSMINISKLMNSLNSKNGESYLYMLAEQANHVALNHFIQLGAHPQITNSPDQKTPLHGVVVGLCASRGDFNSYSACAELLIANGADINAKNNIKRTALWFASANGNSDLVDKLLEKGGDKSIPDAYGCTAAEIAHKNGHLQLAKKLGFLSQEVKSVEVSPQSNSGLNREDFEDPVTCELINEPISLPDCGHTMDRKSASLCFNENKLCPICRTPIASDPIDCVKFPKNILLANIIETLRSKATNSNSSPAKCQKGSSQNNMDGLDHVQTNTIKVLCDNKLEKGASISYKSISINSNANVTLFEIREDPAVSFTARLKQQILKYLNNSKIKLTSERERKLENDLLNFLSNDTPIMMIITSLSSVDEKKNCALYIATNLTTLSENPSEFQVDQSQLQISFNQWQEMNADSRMEARR